MKLDGFGQPTHSLERLFSERRVVCKRTREGLGEVRNVLCDEAGRPRFLELETDDGRIVLFPADEVEPDPAGGIVWALGWADAHQAEGGVDDDAEG